MKSMKSKIRTPFLVLIILFPAAIILLFNAAIRVYIERDTKSELRSVVSAMEAVEKSGPKGNWLNTAEGYDRPMARLYKLVSASRMAVNVDLHVFSRNSKLLYSFDEAEGFADKLLLNKIENRLPSMQEKKIYTVRAGAQRYLVTAYPLTGGGLVRPTVVMVAHMTAQTSWLRAVNLILFGITLAGAAAAVLIANKLSSQIAEPVAELSDMAKKIGDGSYSLPAAGKRDITELDALYQSIAEMSERLEANEKTQRTFLQNASHELKTPLMSIQGYAEGIAKGVITDVKSAAGLIENESKRLGTLVEQLLTLSKIESQTYKKELSVLNLCDVLKDYAQRMGGLAAKYEKLLELDLPDAPLHAKAEDTLLSQAVMNIISNGLRYAKTHVTVKLFRKGSEAVIGISDDGGGIADADLPRVFDRFYKGKQGNSGLGLAIAKSAVETMGGRISAFNDSAGAVFEIALPL